MDTYLYAIVLLIPQLHRFANIIIPLVLITLRFFNIYKYQLEDNNTIKYLHTQVQNDFTFKYDDNNKPIGWIICFSKYYIPKYICYINKSYFKDEYNYTILISTKQQREILLNKKVIEINNNSNKIVNEKNVNKEKNENNDKNKNNEKNEKIIYWDRNQNYYNIGYSKKELINNNNPTNCQRLIINEICNLYIKKNKIICYLYGNIGQGKTFTSYLLADKLKCSLCKTYNPTDPGDKFSELYSIVQPTKENPLIILLDEIDIILNNIHNETLVPHKNLGREVYNKTTWNNFLDNIDFGHFPYLILILCSNKIPSEINNLNPCYIREGRVNYIKEVINKIE